VSDELQIHLSFKSDVSAPELDLLESILPELLLLMQRFSDSEED